MRLLVPKVNGTIDMPRRNGTCLDEPFRAWRERLGLSTRQAAQLLGKRHYVVLRYDDGGFLPRTVKLSMIALADHPELHPILLQRNPWHKREPEFYIAPRGSGIAQ
jgi:hypothetical protein